MRKMNVKNQQAALQSDEWLLSFGFGKASPQVRLVPPAEAERDANDEPVNEHAADEGELPFELDIENAQDIVDDFALAAYEVDVLAEEEEDIIPPEDKEKFTAKTASSRRDMLRSYFEDIGRIPLLSSEETIKLFKQLKKAHKKGEDAGETEIKEKIITANLRLVVSISKRFSSCGVPLLDLIQAGNIGLMRAVDGFDHKLGFKFSTYASRWILASILRTLSNQARIVRIPVNVIPTLKKLKQSDYQGSKVFSRKASPAKVDNTLMLNEKETRKMNNMLQHPISLDQTLDEETGFTVLDTFADHPDEGSSIVKNLDLHLLRKQMEEILDTLEPREQKVLKLRYGLEDGVEYTQSEIAEQMNISRQRVSQLEKRALIRVRASNETRELRDYLN